jgi:hypothetical protein
MDLDFGWRWKGSELQKRLFASGGLLKGKIFVDRESPPEINITILFISL